MRSNCSSQASPFPPPREPAQPRFAAWLSVESASVVTDRDTGQSRRLRLFGEMASPRTRSVDHQAEQHQPPGTQHQVRERHSPGGGRWPVVACGRLAAGAR